MDNLQTAGSPAPSPAKGKVGNLKKATGRGAAKKNARKNVTTLKKGGRPRGRGRNKTYEDPRVQAAYDRQKVLRDLYSEVASAIKPVLEDLADVNVKKLIESPTAHQEVPEFQDLQRQLDDRLEEAMRTAEREFITRTAIATREYQLNTAVTEKKFHVSLFHVPAHLSPSLPMLSPIRMCDPTPSCTTYLLTCLHRRASITQPKNFIAHASGALAYSPNYGMRVST